MKKFIKEVFPILLVLTALFYLLPLMIRDTGSAMSVLLVFIPAGCLIASAVYGIRHSFSFLPAALAMLLFLPAIFIFYNFSAAGYVPAYGILVLAGTGIGAGIRALAAKCRKNR